MGRKATGLLEIAGLPKCNQERSLRSGERFFFGVDCPRQLFFLINFHKYSMYMFNK